jgi:arylsulfatase A-like enzyme
MHVGRSMLRGGAQSLAHLQAYWHEEYSGIVDQRYKYIRKETGAQELFDLAHDVAERKNLAESLPEIRQKYEALTARAFAQKKRYYQKYAGYELTRFNPASQDK